MVWWSAAATSGTGEREKTADQTITVTVTDVDGEAPGAPDHAVGVVGLGGPHLNLVLGDLGERRRTPGSTDHGTTTWPVTGWSPRRGRGLHPVTGHVVVP